MSRDIYTEDTGITANSGINQTTKSPEPAEASVATPPLEMHSGLVSPDLVPASNAPILPKIKKTRKPRAKTVKPTTASKTKNRASTKMASGKKTAKMPKIKQKQAKPKVRKAGITFRKKEVEKEADRRLAKLRSSLVEELEQNIHNVSGETGTVKVGLSFQALYHFITIFLPILMFWSAADEEVEKAELRKQKRHSAKKSEQGGETPKFRLPVHSNSRSTRKPVGTKKVAPKKPKTKTGVVTKKKTTRTKKPVVAKTKVAVAAAV